MEGENKGTSKPEEAETVIDPLEDETATTKPAGEGEGNPSPMLTATTGQTVTTRSEEEPPSDEDENRRVSFHDKVHVAVIPPTPATAPPEDQQEEPTVESSDGDDSTSLANRGAESLAASTFSSETPKPPSVDKSRTTMLELYKEGLEKSTKERAFTSTNVVRSRKRVDIETGASTRREVSALPVWDFREPMNPTDRKVQTAQALATFDDEANGNDNDEPQYRMSAKNIARTKWAHRKEFSWVSGYLQWTFRASFTEIIIGDFIVFMTICLFWTCCIYIGALNKPRCFVVAGTSLDQFPEWHENFFFMDAFQLSWTTFSTVGYGIVYPQVNKGSIDARPDCFVFSFMVTLESFVGVLFAAFCGSIIFGKIARIQSIAAIEWSSPMVIRYGKGVLDKPKAEPKKEGEENEDDDDDSDSSDDDDEDDEKNKSDNPPSTTQGSCPQGNMDESTKSATKAVKYPPPVLEFRVINMLNYQKGGEIMNANLSVLAVTEASKSMESLQLTEERKESISAASLFKLSMELTKKSASTTANVLRKTKDLTQKTGKAVLRRGSEAASKQTGTIVQRVNRAIAKPPSTVIAPGATVSDMTAPLESLSETSELEPFSKAQVEAQEELQKRIAMVSLAAAGQSSMHMAVDEGSGLVPIRIFSKLDIETDTHPFFKRVWNVRHVLNEDSPLLSVSAKRLIQKHRGKWPEEICNPEYIRKNIHFNQIIVSLSGTQNSSGSDVCGMHVYEFKSLNVGYTFAQMLDVTDDGLLYLDVDLLNDVREQRGGGGEDIRGFLVDEFGQEIEPDEEDDEQKGDADEDKVDGTIPAKIFDV